MAAQGYVQELSIMQNTDADTIVATINEAFKPVYKDNSLPFFPKWHFL
jgi:hypothetical protein